MSQHGQPSVLRAAGCLQGPGQLPVEERAVAIKRGKAEVMLEQEQPERLARFLGLPVRARSYWKTKESGKTFGLLLLKHNLGLSTFDSYCAFFDRQLAGALQTAGGTKYARLAVLAHRQSLAGAKLVADASGMPLWFP